jgi:hypothetical protein
MRLSFHILLIILILELAALFIQHYQPGNNTIIYSMVNSLIGYIISNYIFKNSKVQEKLIKKIKSSKEKKIKSDLDCDNCPGRLDPD